MIATSRPRPCADCGEHHGGRYPTLDGGEVCWPCRVRRDPGLAGTNGDASRERGVAGGNPLRPVPPATPTAPKLTRCDIGTMLTTEPEPVDEVIDGIAARGTLAMLVGREKVGKSLLGLAFASRMVTGGGTLAGIACKAGRVLVVDAENGRAEIHRRVRTLGIPPSAQDRLEVYEARGFDLTADLADLDRLLQQHKPDIALFDSWRSLWTGEENDSRTASAVLDPLRELVRVHNVAGVLLHHANKLGAYRGSTAVGASVENIVEVTKHEDDPDRQRRRLRNPSCRYGPEADDRWVRIETDEAHGLLLIDECDPYHPSGEQREGIKDRLLAGLTATAITWAAWAKTVDLDPKDRTARRARDGLLADGLVDRTAEGGWKTAHADGEPPLIESDHALRLVEGDGGVS